MALIKLGDFPECAYPEPWHCLGHCVIIRGEVLAICPDHVEEYLEWKILKGLVSKSNPDMIPLKVDARNLSKGKSRS